MLASAESRVKYLPAAVRVDVVADLARFLGATSRVWTAERWRRLHALLAEAGRLSVGPILRAVATTPREEIIDDAVMVLARVAETSSEDVAAFFVDALTLAPVGGGVDALP
jgi:hypothetical protein